MPSLRDCRMLHASAAGRGLYTSLRSFTWACLCSSSHTGFLHGPFAVSHQAFPGHLHEPRLIPCNFGGFSKFPSPISFLILSLSQHQGREVLVA